MTEHKYITFKYDEFDEWVRLQGRSMNINPSSLPAALADAVVIRTQDVFAAPALDAYANSIRVATQTAEQFVTNNGMMRKKMENLNAIADYFHEQAFKAWSRQDKKLPD